MADENPLRILASRAAAPRIVSELSRRRFLSLSAIVGGTAFLAACSAGGAKPAPSATGGKLAGSLSMYSWGDYGAPEVLKDVTETVGPKLTVDSFGSNEEL
ncbi:MAG: spermidine/putrescine ABC transporter substrate-binding protein, partial [Microbacterium sp.]|nr:spermidine/putrescine ABC transporter substrate-binding protein [Microbacterium sp.]